MLAPPTASISALDGSPDLKLRQEFKRATDRRRKYAFGVEARDLKTRRHELMHGGGADKPGRSTRPASPASLTCSSSCGCRAHRVEFEAQKKALGKHPAINDSDFVGTADNYDYDTGIAAAAAAFAAKAGTSPSSSSADESVHGEGEAVDANVDVMYSFDAPRGPTRGNDVLSGAISRAVERFETKETEKLVRAEYDIVTHEAASELDHYRDHEHAGYVADEDEDFELI